MMKCKIVKFSGLRLILSKMQSLLPLRGLLEALLSFFLSLETKIQNGEQTIFLPKILHGI